MTTPGVARWLPEDDISPERSCTEQKGGGMGAEREERGGEMLPMLAGGWRASALRGEEAGRFREVAGVSIVAAGGPCSR